MQACKDFFVTRAKRLTPTSTAAAILRCTRTPARRGLPSWRHP